MIIGIDFGGTRIKLGLVHEGKLLDTEIIVAKSAEAIGPRLPVIENWIKSTFRRNKIPVEQLMGIGAAFPSIVDSRAMRVLTANNKYPDAGDIDMKQWALDVFGVPFVMENDARMALIGEWQYGAGKGYEDIVMVTLGTGYGAAALIEGSLLRGKHFVAGCMGGHLSINYNGAPCWCGNVGCVEVEASSWRLKDLAVGSPKFALSQLSQIPEIDYEHVFRLAEQQDTLSQELKAHSIRAWAFGMVNLVHAYDPELVIVSGGIIKRNDGVLTEFQEIIQTHTWNTWGTPKVVKAQWPEESAILGCEYLSNQHAIEIS
jgi:glucokinase